MSVIFKVTTQYLTLTSQFNFGKCVLTEAQNHEFISHKEHRFFLILAETRLEVLTQYWYILSFVVVL